MNILGMGPLELLLIVVLALIVFGPARLPEIMAQVGKAIGDFRRATSELSDEFNRTIQAELQETRAVIDETKATVVDAHSSVTSAFTGTPAPTLTALPPAEVVQAPNGTTADPYATTNGTNGSVSVQATPPLADTARWSWETSASPSPATPAAEPEKPTAALEPPASAAEAGSETTGSTPPAAPPDQKPAARDELLPPY